jgi:prolyl-tRNA synthetase
MQDGKALQAGTSHDLGQNFGKAFNVQFQTQAGALDYVWQTSWGVSTRLIGGLIMTHSDDAGLVLPPRLAPIHAVIVPIFRSDDERSRVLAPPERIKAALVDIDIAPPRARYRDFLEVVVDDRDMKPGAKFYDWERRGVPVRVELGPKDLEKDQVCVKMRVDSEAGKRQGVRPRGRVHRHLHRAPRHLPGRPARRARQRLRDRSVTLDTWDEFLATFAGDRAPSPGATGTAPARPRRGSRSRPGDDPLHPAARPGPAPEPGQLHRHRQAQRPAGPDRQGLLTRTLRASGAGSRRPSSAAR